MHIVFLQFCDGSYGIVYSFLWFYCKLLFWVAVLVLIVQILLQHNDFGKAKLHKCLYVSFIPCTCCGDGCSGFGLYPRSQAFSMLLCYRYHQSESPHFVYYAFLGPFVNTYSGFFTFFILLLDQLFVSCWTLWGNYDMCLMFQDICRSDVACTWWLSSHLTENDRWFGSCSNSQLIILPILFHPLEFIEH